MSPEIQDWIDRLDLIVHPEGGWYRETYRSDQTIPQSALPEGYRGDRVLMTSILYLLPAGMCSRWHRVRSEELWMHHRGDDLMLGILPPAPGIDSPELESGKAEIRLGQGASAEFQAIVPPRHWQEARVGEGDAGFAIVGCVVAPGFEFEDFEMAN